MSRASTWTQIAVEGRPAVPLGLMLSADGVAIGVHLFGALVPGFDDPGLSLATDGGFAEMLQYVKEASISIVLLIAAARGFGAVLGAWAVLFGYLLLDDALMVHERLGALVAARLDGVSVPLLRAQDIGELVVTGSAALVLLTVIAAAHRRSPIAARRESRYLMALLIALATFGVGADMLHDVHASRIWRGALVLVEDAGEMIVMSVIAAFVLSRTKWWFAPDRRL